MSVSDDERSKLYEEQTGKQFEALGRFVQAFELMVHSIRLSLQMRLQQESNSMFHFTQLIFHHRALTALPLWDLFRSVIYVDVSEVRPNDPSDVQKFEDVLTKLNTQVVKLIETRNNILHGTSLIGAASEGQQDFSQLVILKGGVSAKGYKQAKTPESEVELLALVEQCESLTRTVNAIALAARLQGHHRSQWLARAAQELPY